MRLKIFFDNQAIKYDFSSKFQSGILQIQITFPESFTLRNEKRLTKLTDNILANCDEIIQDLINDNKAQLVESPEFIFEETINFSESLSVGHSRDQFFFESVIAETVTVQSRNLVLEEKTTSKNFMI